MSRWLEEFALQYAGSTFGLVNLHCLTTWYDMLN